MYSFSANSKGEEALLHPQNSYLLVIQKKNEGFFSFITFEAPATTPAEIESRVRIMENVLRYLIIRKEA